jgi:hypothetical protein
MLKRKLIVPMCTSFALFSITAAANAATLTVSVTPTNGGTTQSPQPHTTSLSLTNIDPGLGGNANSAMLTLVESLPADFQATFGTYATCSPNVVVHGDNKPNCPAGSVLGHVTATAFVPALAFDTTSDQGYIFKIGPDRVGAWVHVSHPIGAGIAVYGTISPGAAPFGPVTTWDMTPLADGAQTGAEVRLNAVAFSWDQQPGTGSTSGSGASNRALHACETKARRIKGKHKRQAALRRCIKAAAKARPKPQPTAPAPFASTGCTSGRWPFQAQMTFNDHTTQTASATVACKAG